MSFPSRDYIGYLERKIQEMERRFENFHRVGTVPKDGVKYDDEKKRWFVKIEQQKDSGTFTSDWLPWECQANSWMKVSSPPAEGQSIQLISPFGTSELGSCSPYHNNQDTPSPSGKVGEHHMRIEKPADDGKPGNDPKKILSIGYTQDGSTVQIGDTTHGLTADAQTVTTKNNAVTTDNDTKTVSDTHTLTTNKRVVQAKDTTIQSAKYSVAGKVLINC